MFRTLFFICVVSIARILFGCTKLKEDFRGDLSQGQVAAGSVNTAALLEGVYNSLEGPFTSHLVIFPLMEMTTDEAIFPTRGSDWDDNGTWRALHQQKWNATNNHTIECFNNLNGTVYAATDLLRYNPQPSEQAEARLLRAFANFLLLDLFDQVPYREPGESVIQPSRVRKGLEALNYIISELNAVEANLPDGPAGRANKFAAKTLLMKCYLNKAVYVNRENPSFEGVDMNKVISLADEIINSNKFSFSANYFDNFAPDNTNIGKENIFTQLNVAGATANNVLFLGWLIPLHYNQGGINGWATLSDFYNKFETSDKRRGMVYSTSSSPPNPGNRINVGFLAGQQYDLTTDVPLTDRSNAPLFFTSEVKNIETGVNLEVTGIRPVKYFPDYASFFSPDNDYVYFRFSDVLLMKAEAILRGGAPTNAGAFGSSAVSIVNAIRTHSSRNATLMSSPVTLENLLEERGRELWFEGWRRQDLIRFKKFLLPFQEKNYQSDPKYLLFPIPADQLAVNPNLVQNPGY